jgi:hypothetical protein
VNPESDGPYIVIAVNRFSVFLHGSTSLKPSHLLTRLFLFVWRVVSFALSCEHLWFRIESFSLAAFSGWSTFEGVLSVAVVGTI